MAWSESRPNLTKHSSYHNVSKILVVQESNVSSELNPDLVVRLCFSVTKTIQEERHYQSFIICKPCVYKKSVKNELKVQTIWADDFGIEEMSRMIPPSISQNRTLFQNALPPLY